MPTKRERKTHAFSFEYDYATQTHLETGDCCLAGPDRGCNCGLRGPDGEPRMDLIRRMWQAHRDEILAAWPGENPPWAAQFE